MRCPKCGQEMIHINNQYICTTCGIVANEFSPKSQVLASIKSKMAEKASGRSEQEEYVSPVAVAAAKRPQSGVHFEHQNIPQNTVPDGMTLDKIIKEMAMSIQRPGTSVAGEQEDYLAVGEEGEKVIPRIDSGTDDTEVGSEGKANAEPVAQIEPQTAPQDSVQPQMSQIPQNVAISPDAAQQMAQPLMADPQLASAPAATQAIYPSHQVNPILIKTLITVFAILIVCVIGYFAFNSAGLKGLFDNLVKYLGVST